MTRPAGSTIYTNSDTDSRERFIVLGVPTFGMVSISWHQHVMQLQNPLNRQVYHTYVRGFEVGKARNLIIKHALDFENANGHTASHVFFIDDDVLVPPYALSVLLAEKRPIVSGLYYAKTEAPQPLVLMGPRDGVMDPIPRNRVVECYAHGMGCTLIEMRVFKDLIANGMVAYEDLGQIKDVPIFFSTTRDALMPQTDGQPLTLFNQTEDVFFLNKASRLGYTAAVHTGVFCFHWDEKKQVGFPLHYWKEFQETGNVMVGEEVAA